MSAARSTTIVGGAVATLVAALGVIALSDGLPGFTGTDTSERRKYTLIADTSMHRARIDAIVTSSTGARIMTIVDRRVRTTWKTSVWANAGEVIFIEFNVRTYGDHTPRQAPWARCQVLRGGGGVGGDAEVDQLPVLRAPEDLKRQAEARCDVNGG